MDARPYAGRTDKHRFNLGLAAIPPLRLQMVYGASTNKSYGLLLLVTLISLLDSQKQIENGVRSQSARVKNLIRTKYQELGPTSFNEKTILFLFPVLVMLWMFRDPKFIAGWGSLFSKYETQQQQMRETNEIN